ncbi:MAG TPA: ABC transporter permease [Nevskia sp.]|nr:ABC transporter permease [Nevskia sp.]
MFRYYLWLAVRSLRRNPVLTALMVTAIGLGIGASMTTLTMFRAMSGDPIPDKSSRLFAPQIDNWGPDHREKAGEPPQVQLSYTDAHALLEAHRGLRQTAMYATAFALTPADPQMRPFHATGRAAYADFFAMFEAPFRWGGPWGKAEDDGRADVVVISKPLNDKLFGGGNSVGKTLRLEQRDYRIVGVLDHWQPQPRVYDVVNSTFGDTEDVFLPFTTAIDEQLAYHGNNSCIAASTAGWEGHLRSECTWTQFWVELASADDAPAYRRFLDDYAAEQQRNGRFHWAPLTRLSNVAQWMKLNHVVSDESRIMVAVSFGFLFVCLVNAVGLMLAKFMSRAGETGVRRALGATRRAIFLQCLVETGVIGLGGAALGLALTALGLAGMRASFSEDLVHLLQLDPVDVALAVLLAVSSALLAGLYPNWRATQVQPAWQLKSN